MFGGKKFGGKRSMGVAVACAVATVVAGPAGVVGAAGVPKAVISGGYLEPGADSTYCEYGTKISFSGANSTDPDGGVLQYEWSDTLGGEASEDGKSFGFSCEGTNQLTLKVTNAAGLSDTATVQVASNKTPTLTITPVLGVDVDAVAVGESITLTATATDPEGGPVTFEDWVFPGPFSASFEIDPTGTKITFHCEEEGFTPFGIGVVDDVGFRTFDGSTLTCRVRPTGTVFPAPVVLGKRTVVPVGTTVEFKPFNLSFWMDYAWRTTGVPGVASTEDSFTRKFDKPGLFGVELHETNELGTAKQWVGYQVVAPPTVAVSPAPADPKARMRVPLGSTLTFDGSGSRSPGGSLSYAWNTTGTSGVAGDGARFVRKFDKTGNFGVQLTVTNDLGQTATRWVGVTVFKSEPPVASVTPAPKDPKARMEVTVGQTVTFNGGGSRDPDGGELTYQWRTTGVRGIAGTGGTYSRKFEKAGLYGVELIVIDDEGQYSKRWVGLTVVP